MLKRVFYLLITIGLLHTSNNALGQYDEYGIQLGVSRYKGELSPHLFDTKFIHFAGGVFYRHNWTRHWSWKLELNYARISGDDSKLSTGFEQNRKLKFFSSIFEATPAVEFNFFPYEAGNPNFGFTPYFFGGFSAFIFNPKSDLGGSVVELQPLGTEGQGLPGRQKYYNRLSFSIPFGGGLKIGWGMATLALQVSARRTYTDYLDDVSTTYPDMIQLQAARGSQAVFYSDPAQFSDSSLTYSIYPGKQRGNESDNDWYMLTTVCLSFRVSSLWNEYCKPFKRRRY